MNAVLRIDETVAAARADFYGWRNLGQTGNALNRPEGLVGDVLLTVCYVERGRRKRIISARKATNREQVDYNEANAPSPNGR